MRSVAPRASGVRRSCAHRTGAPAWARTALTPIVRSSVLFPDMFDPLTTSSCVSFDNRTSFGTARAAGMSGCAIRVASNCAVPATISGH